MAEQGERQRVTVVTGGLRHARISFPPRVRRTPRTLSWSVAATAAAKPAQALGAPVRPPGRGQRLGSVPRCPVLASIRAISTRARAMTAANPTTHTPRSTITNAVVPAMPALHPRHSKWQVHYKEHAHPGPPRNRPVRATTSTYDCMSPGRDLWQHEAASPYALHTSRPSPAPALAPTPTPPGRDSADTSGYERHPCTHTRHGEQRSSAGSARVHAHAHAHAHAARIPPAAVPPTDADHLARPGRMRAFRAA